MIYTRLLSVADGALAMLPLPMAWWLSPWVVVSLLLLFVGYSMSVASSANSIALDLSKFFSKKERATFAGAIPQHFFYARLFLFLVSMLCMGFLSFRMAMFWGYDMQPLLVLLFAAIFLSFILGSELLMVVIGAIFFCQKQCRRYIKHYFSLVAYSAILLFPLCLFALYAPVAISRVCVWLGVGVCCLLMLALLFKLFQIFFDSKVALVYLFLYLCAWKILPILALLKALGESVLIVKL